MLTIYDWHGNYGHPDHIQVHRVGQRAAAIAGTPAVFEATMNRDAFARMIAAAREAGEPLPGETPDGPGDDFDPTGPADDGNPFGMPEAELTHEVDVTAWVERKRASIACHTSQVTDIELLPADAATSSSPTTFGTEWYIKQGDPPGMRAGVAARVTRIHLVRHGRAAAGWNTDPDPGLDDLGHGAGRCGGRPAAAARTAADPDQSAAALPRDGRPARDGVADRGAGRRGRGGDPVAGGRRHRRPRRVAARRDARHVDATSGPRYTAFRDGVAQRLLARRRPTPWSSATSSRSTLRSAPRPATTRLVVRSLDNCSVTVIDVVDGMLRLVEGGDEADTLIR